MATAEELPPASSVLSLREAQDAIGIHDDTETPRSSQDQSAFKVERALSSHNFSVEEKNAEVRILSEPRHSERNDFPSSLHAQDTELLQQLCLLI